MKNIFVKGACQHNLKNIDVEIPRNKLVVITGVSGSGKSSLAFDTIYAEGQRRYVESLSAYARQFLEQMDKPDVEYIEGLSPAISIEQKGISKNPRSTVGTITEIFDYLRLLYARIGTPHCPKCGREIAKQTPTQIVDQILNLDLERIQILAPIVRGRKGEYKSLFKDLQGKGFVRVRVDSKLFELEEEIELDKYKKHTIEVVVDRLRLSEGVRGRLTDSVETSLELSEGLVVVSSKEREYLFGTELSCPECGISFEELSPRMFSFNSPFGACPQCHGLGTKLEIDEELVISDKNKSILDGAIVPYARSEDSWTMQRLYAVARHYGFSLKTPIRFLKREHLDKILYGSGREKIKSVYSNEDRDIYFESAHPFEGVIPTLERRFKQTKSEGMRRWYGRFMSKKPCSECGGKRLRPESLAVKIASKDIMDVCELSVKEAFKFFSNLKLSKRDRTIAKQILKEIRERLYFLISVGLEYLTLDRRASSLSGGEGQRIRLATQIGSSLVGVLYILDEPSIGLHQRDNHKLLAMLSKLRDLGNTVIVIEHDKATMEASDYIIDMGPGAGVHGGEIVACGKFSEIALNENSLTGKYLKGELEIKIPKERAKPKGFLKLIGARHNNLKNIDVEIPLGVFTCITGVSGSGKSSLINDTLNRALSREFFSSKKKPGVYRRMEGLEKIDKVITIDQSPIGRTPRSNPATYTNVFTPIRELYATLKESRMRGYRPGRFSFNVRGGRCEACEGNGIIKIEMHFLPDVYVPCEVCKGARFNRETLEIKYKGRSISDVLEMTVEEALELFKNIPRIKRKLQTLHDVGLSYIKLGQPATTLSGGEAQRVKLSKELSKSTTGSTIYFLDEPTTGLHFHDIKKLLSVLQRLKERGNTIVVIEHNLDVIKMADWIIDLGPEGGDEGGYVVATGTPEEVARTETYTGEFLRKVLKMEIVVG
ncbi:MAG: excinuclease ABC subunit UvrA [Candidatus Methanofastidiosia archaeon]